jgi:hypothetical protein
MSNTYPSFSVFIVFEKLKLLFVVMRFSYWGAKSGFILRGCFSLTNWGLS